jgi:uncharacterized protein (TIGR03435 family)
MNMQSAFRLNPSPKVVTALALTLVAATAVAQPAEVSPSFEVASVRRTELLDGGRFGAWPGGRFQMVNGTVELLITWAYDVRLADLVIGAPDWVRAERYDVNAKAADSTASIPQQKLMMQALLRERFKLQIAQRQEMRPVYELVLARPDGGLGPKLKTVAIDCDAWFREMTPGKTRPRPPSIPADVEPCTTLSNPTSMKSGGTSIAALASSLTYMVQRIVIEKTGLKGYYTYELEYEPSGMLSARATSTLPSIFTALQEQLGLRLQSARAPVDVLVIERIERPTVD